MLEYRKVRSLRRIRKTTQVYNFSVPRYESYVANGLVVHNCQNFKVSQSGDSGHKVFQPQELIDLSVVKKTAGIAFTYNEPTIHYEYLTDVGIASISCQPKPYLAIKTNGFAELPIIRNLALFFPAWNVDIKGDDQEYQNLCGGMLDPVFRSIELLAEMDVHLEISYLVLPRFVGHKKHHRRVRDFLSEIDPWIPVHILNFYPSHKMPAGSYPHTELMKVVDIFRVKMRRVYISNSYNKDAMPYRETCCLECGKLLIQRTRRTTVKALSCCNRKVRGVFLPGSV